MTSRKPTLGSLLRSFRKERNWTLWELSDRAGIPPSTLAKVERDLRSLSFERLLQLHERVQLPVFRLFSPADAGPRAESAMISGRRSVGRLADAVHSSTPGYDNYELCADLRQKQMLPSITMIRTRELGELQRECGEQFIYVLQGAIDVHTEFYAPVELGAGECIYIDAGMAYACVATGDCDEASVLRVVSRQVIGRILADDRPR